MMKRKERLKRGEILFSAIVAVEIPHEASFRRTIYANGNGGCRVVCERANVYSSYHMSREECDRMLEAYLSIIPPPAGDGPGERPESYGD